MLRDFLNGHEVLRALCFVVSTPVCGGVETPKWVSTLPKMGLNTPFLGAELTFASVHVMTVSLHHCLHFILLAQAQVLTSKVASYPTRIH